jgi:hypothetical protein
LVLRNKSYQATRFVRSFVKGGTAGLRNLPTIAHIWEEEYEAAVLDCNNITAVNIRKTLDELRKCSNIALIIGIIQILEIYTKASLASQHLVWFPTQVWSEINIAKQNVASLAEKWVWEDAILEIGGIGSPKALVENLK